MSCDEILELLSASLDGELTAAEEVQVQAHLDQCPHCRALMAELSAIHEACGHLDAVPPPELAENILRALPPQTAPKVSKVLYWKRWGAMAAAAVLVVMTVWKAPSLFSTDMNTTPAPEAVQDRSSDETMAQDAPEPVPSSDSTDALPSYVFDEVVNANAIAPDSVAGDGSDSAAAVEAYSDHIADTGGADEKSAAKRESQPTAKLASPVPSVSYFALSGGIDDLETADITAADITEGGGASAAPFMILRTAAPPADELPELQEASARSEVPPAMGADEWDTAAVDLEETVQVADAFSSYCGVLTISQGCPSGDYPAQVQEDGQVWYTLPAADFFALVRELREGDLPYDLRLNGEDISAEARQGLLIIEEPIPTEP